MIKKPDKYIYFLNQTVLFVRSISSFFSQIIYEINYIRPAGDKCELILAGKLQLKKLQKKKPEKRNSGFDGA